MLPAIARSMSSSLGSGLCARSAAADMICPGWQYPHWTTSSWVQACWTGWPPSGERPSMVVIFRSPTAETGSTQERTASPSRWTVQAPHCAIPHPNFVPVSPRTSRKTQRRGMSPGASTSRGVPFTVICMAPPKAWLASILRKMRELFARFALRVNRPARARGGGSRSPGRRGGTIRCAILVA